MTEPRLLPLELQLIAVAALLGFLGWVIHLARRDRLSLRDALLWLTSTLVALALMAFPGALRFMARALGVEVPANGLFALAFLYVLVNLLSATTAISANAVRTRRLAQECALLRAELEELRGRIDGGGRADPP